MAAKLNIARCVALGAVFVLGAAAEARVADADPYSVIAQRNIFRLKAVLPATEAVAASPAAARQVLLSGFARIGEEWSACMVVKMDNPDPRAAPLDAYLNLKEGAKKVVGAGGKGCEVEVRRISLGQEKVEAVVDGKEVTLSLKENGVTNRTPLLEKESPSGVNLAALNPGPQVDRRTGRPIRNVSGAAPRPPKPERVVAPAEPAAVENSNANQAASPVEGDAAGAPLP